MGGKGGDSGGGGGGSAVYDPETEHYYVNGIALDETGSLSGKTREQILAERAPPPAPAPVVATPMAAPEPEPVPIPEPTPAPQATAPTGPPITSGGAFTQPTAAGNPAPGATGGTLGGQLGESVIRPPTYWVGGTNTYGRGPGRGQGRMTTTQS